MQAHASCADGDDVTSLHKVACVAYPSMQSREERDLPLEVFDKSTWHMVFNGRDHYWPAVVQGSTPTLADLEEAGMVLDVRKSKRPRPSATAPP